MTQNEPDALQGRQPFYYSRRGIKIALNVCMSTESSLLEYFVVSTSKYLLTFRNIVVYTVWGQVIREVHLFWTVSPEYEGSMLLRLGRAVGIATGYGLDGPGIESRWGPRFSTPVQTGPGAHSASCKMGTGSFPGVKSGQGVTLTPHCKKVWVEELSVTKRESMFVPSSRTHHCQPYPSR